MVLVFVLQHLLQVQAASQVALSQVVAELRNAEQTLLRAHCFAVCKNKTHTHTHKQTNRGREDRIRACKERKSVLKSASDRTYRIAGGFCGHVMAVEWGRRTQMNTNTTDETRRKPAISSDDTVWHVQEDAIDIKTGWIQQMLSFWAATRMWRHTEHDITSTKWHVILFIMYTLHTFLQGEHLHVELQWEKNTISSTSWSIFF